MAKKELLCALILLLALSSANAFGYNQEVQKFLDSIIHTTEKVAEKQKQDTLESDGTQTFFSNDTSFYSFVSLSMPKESLKQIAIDTKKYGGVLAIRGLKDNSFPKTIKVMENLIKETGVTFNIDPELFDKFQVTLVPTYVLDNGNYDKMIGNVTVPYFLEQVKKKGDLSHNIRESS